MEKVGSINWSELLPILITIVLIQLIVQIVALVDLYKRETVLGKKWIWVLVIIVGEIFGAAAYLIFGRKEA